MAILSDVELSKMNRKDLLFLIKQYGLRGTGTNEVLRERLLEAQIKEKEDAHTAQDEHQEENKNEEETEMAPAMARPSSHTMMTPAKQPAQVVTGSPSSNVSHTNRPVSNSISQKSQSARTVTKSPQVVTSPGSILRSPLSSFPRALLDSAALATHCKAAPSEPYSADKNMPFSSGAQLRKPTVRLATSASLSVACSLALPPTQSPSVKGTPSAPPTARHPNKPSALNPMPAPRLTKSALLRAALNTQRAQEIKRQQQAETDRMVALGIKKEDKKGINSNGIRHTKENRAEPAKSKENMHASTANSLPASGHLKGTKPQKALNYVPHRGPLQPYQSNSLQKKNQV